MKKTNGSLKATCLDSIKALSFEEKAGLLLLAAVWLANVLFMASHRWLTDSDMANEVLLAQHLNETGRIVSADWLYTTEVRFFNLQWFFRLPLLIPGISWHAARTIGMGLLWAVYAAAAIIMMKKAGCGKERYALGALVLMPLGSICWFLGLYGGYLIVYAAIALAAYSLLLEKGRTAFVCGLVLAVCSGMNGVKQMMVSYAPLLLAVLWHSYEKKDAGMAAKAAAFAGANGVGMLMNKVVFADISYVSFSNVRWSGSLWSAAVDIDGLLKVWTDFFGLFGYQGGVKLFSFAGIAGGLGILTAAVVLLSLIVGRKEKTLLWKYILLALAVDGIAFSSLEAPYNPSYWLAVYPFALLYGAMMLPRLHKLAVWILLWAGVVCSLATVSREAETPLRAKRGLQESVAWLLDNGYREGMATFWSGDAAVEMSDGKLEVWTLDAYGYPFDFAWGQKRSHLMQLPQGKVFLLVDRSEDSHVLRQKEAAYQNAYYTVLVYDDISALMEDMR